MDLISLTVQRIEKENFSPFGTFVTVQEASFSCDTFDWHECLASFNIGVAELGFVRARRWDAFQRELERHNKTKEVIVPLEKDLILVLAKGEAESAVDFMAFCLPVGTAAILNEGTWHHAPKCVSGTAGAFVFYSEKTGSQDKEIIKLSGRGLEVKISL